MGREDRVQNKGRKGSSSRGRARTLGLNRGPATVVKLLPLPRPLPRCRAGTLTWTTGCCVEEEGTGRTALSAWCICSFVPPSTREHSKSDENDNKKDTFHQNCETAAHEMPTSAIGKIQEDRPFQIIPRRGSLGCRSAKGSRDLLGSARVGCHCPAALNRGFGTFLDARPRRASRKGCRMNRCCTKLQAFGCLCRLLNSLQKGKTGEGWYLPLLFASGCPALLRCLGPLRLSRWQKQQCVQTLCQGV